MWFEMVIHKHKQKWDGHGYNYVNLHISWKIVREVYCSGRYPNKAWNKILMHAFPIQIEERNGSRRKRNFVVVDEENLHALHFIPHIHYVCVHVDTWVCNAIRMEMTARKHILMNGACGRYRYQNSLSTQRFMGLCVHIPLWVTKSHKSHNRFSKAFYACILVVRHTRTRFSLLAV